MALRDFFMISGAGIRYDYYGDVAPAGGAGNGDDSPAAPRDAA